MISTDLQRVQIQDIVEYQLPAFVKDDFPLVSEFLKQYYISQEYPTAPSDIIQNIDEYVKLETLLSSQEDTNLGGDVSFSDTEISVGVNINLNQYGTYQFPERYGLIKIDDEIILYTSKDRNTFKGCVRGFSGVTSLDNGDKLTFSTSEATSHVQGSTVTNLSNILLKEFLSKLKQQIAPGFEKREINSDVNQKLFLSRAKDFYQSKGTDESFRILFAALYGEKAEVVKPKEFLFSPSDAQYRKTKDIVVEAVVGDPSKLKNQTLYQDAYPEYGIESAYATIVDSEKIFRGDKIYYQLSVDFDYSKDIDLTGGTILGDFVTHPKTQNTVLVASGSSIIDVDSTIGFPDKGQIFVNGQSGILTYRSKTINQFTEVGLANTSTFGTNYQIPAGTELNLNVSAYAFEGISAVSVASSDASAVGIATTSKIEVRIGKVLGKNIIVDDTYYFAKNDNIKIKSLGINASEALNNSWLVNISPKYDVKNVTLIDSSNFTYNIETNSKNNLRIGDKVIAIQSDSVEKQGIVIDIISEKEFTFSRAGKLTGTKFSIRRDILKPDVNNSIIDEYSYIEKTFANVQNTYTKYNGDVLVAASSIPSYHDTPLNFYDRKIPLNGEYNGELFTLDRNHGFYTGDRVYYEASIESESIIIEGQTVVLESIASKFPEIDSGSYYVKRVNDKQFKIASSITNLYNDTFISVSGIVTNNYFCTNSFYNKNLEHQKLYREFKSPVNDGGNYVTLPGKTGMLINGVEILNYKSGDSIYFGGINKLTVSAPGSGYDIINPPILSIQDSTGIGATGFVNVKGSLERIEILDPGFDYITEPIITITGGNGLEANAYANTKLITHSVSFYSTSDNDQVGLSSDTIGFSTFHKFRESERVVYKTDGQTAIGGITDNAEYYVKLVDSKTIKLFANESDITSGSNPVNLTSNGEGVHRFESFSKKRIVSDVVVTSAGLNYENKERTCGIIGINTALNQINILNHGFNSGDIITYSGNSSGLSNDQNYIVTTVDSDNFKLSSVGIGVTAKLFYYNTNQYVNIKSTGSGSHTFKYPTISVNISGEIGVSTFVGQDFNAKLQPIFRGSIESIHLTSNGVGYGSSDIINYNRQPNINLMSGRDAALLPIVNNGRIEEVLVINGGYEYNSPPNLVINGVGRFAKLTPVISEGQIKKIIVDNPGTNYTDTTTISVIASGQGANISADINQWTINLFEKYQDIISEDDGILDTSLIDEYGIQYTHLYAPRKLRQSVFGQVISDDDGVKYGLTDLRLDSSNSETGSQFHSPIIGWAYDGNPIYGPYGYDTNTGGNVRALKSGYKLSELNNRPSLSSWKQGFFCEDFVFTGEGDLDEHNGRYCVTPDFPNGVYAYFATINDGSTESSGPFENFKLPQYPYFIGNKFKSKPNDFNFKNDSYQGKYDIEGNKWLRNTTPYGLTLDNVSYDFVTEPYKIYDEVIKITSTSVGTIDNVGIVTGGSGYQVGDRVVFETLPGSTSAKAKVSEVSGKVVTNVSVASSTVSELEIAPIDSSGRFVAFSDSPHQFTNTDLVTLSGFNTSINLTNNSFNIGVSTSFYNLGIEVGTTDVTGIVTYFSVSGGIVDTGELSIRENDILKIGTEKVRILNVDRLNSRLRVERAVDETVSSAHTATSLLSEQSRKFTFNSNRENKVKFELNNQIYFDPRESVGVGTLTGTGVGSTIFFSNPGAGITQVFIENRGIFLPDHNLRTGDVVLYNNGGGQSIEVVTNPSVGPTYRIANNTSLYVARISEDIIGIQTFKVGIGSTGTFVGIADTTMNSGLLSFTGIGTGTKHSIETVKTQVVNAEATRNAVTVATASTHGLSIGDKVKMTVTPGITNRVTVKYNDHNRRIVFNPLGFATAGVSTEQNTITIIDHGFSTGDKVILDSNPAPSGLEDQKIYYVSKFSKDKFKLCETKYESEKFQPNFVPISVAREGNILPINPPLNAFVGNTVVFDLSDSSLSSLNASTLYSAFDMNLYRDSNYSDRFEGSLTNNTFEVKKSGKVGIDANANLTLVVNDNIPKNLFYIFTNANSDFIESTKKEIIVDEEVTGFNKIDIVNSSYQGEFVLTGVGTTSFNYDISKIPERSSYSSINGELSYTTRSTNAYGGIADIEVTYKGSNYKDIVGVSTIVGIVTGRGAILEPSSNTIGKIVSTKIENIGFNYPTDNTLRPTTNLPEVLLLESLTSFEEIEISSAGKNYNIAPNLVVLDGLTGNIIDDVDLFFRFGDPNVTIRKNTSGLSNVTPTIIPVNNSNGVAINDISFDITTKNVTVGFDTGFGDQSPFSVGDKVLIENVSVGVGSTGSGYNSVDFGYQLFTLTDVNIPLGGNIGIVTFSLSGIIDNNLYAGNYDSINSSGRIINQNSFPQFNIKLRKNNFLLGEKVYSNSGEGIVNSWNNRIELLKVSTSKDFKVGDIVVGQSSGTQGTIKSKTDFNSEIRTEASSIIEKGWNRTTGFFNDNQQRIPDNFYYQNFSYAIKSKIPLQKWEDAVSSLNHTAGFLKFSDLIIESINGTRVFTDNSSSISVTVDILPEPVYGRGELANEFGGGISLNCYPAFDLITEDSKIASGTVYSDRIFFENKILTDYFESVGNRVLTIDDFSTQFNNQERPTRFSVVKKFPVDQRSKKILTFVRDKVFTGERQTSLVTLIQDGENAEVLNYGRVESVLDLGSFDFRIVGSEGELLFYPTKYQNNNYNISYCSFDLDNGVSGIGTYALGEICDIESTQVEIPESTKTTIVGIASTYRSSKILVEFNSNTGVFGFNELNVIHDGTTAQLLEYGDLSTDLGSTVLGFGTYSVEISSGTVNVDFTPNPGFALTTNTVRVSMSSTESVGVGTTVIGGLGENVSELQSFYTSISSSATPGINTIAEYTTSGINDYKAAYYLVSVEDITNNQSQLTELIVLNDDSESFITEYGTLTTGSGIGTFGAFTNSSATHLRYTPPANVDVETRVFQQAIQLVSVDDTLTHEIDLNNASITAGYGFYEGTRIGIKRAFGLTHRGLPIFLRNFDGSDSAIVNTTDDTIRIPDHFFTTGEEVNYSVGISTHVRIGIAETSFAGIGNTNILPTNTPIYVIKDNDNSVRLASSAQNANAETPVAIGITGIGIGTFHTFTSNKQNTKCLIALDNYIQNPIVSTAVTTSINKEIGLADAVITTLGITSFFSADLIQIESEIMKINTVGFGTTNGILVDRGWMGTGITTHPVGVAVTKVDGAYNIVGNTINFYTAPQGPTPLSSTSSPSDRDFTGITTHSKFQGRTFLRSEPTNSTIDAYNTNYIFDSIADQFDATTKTFTLKSENQDVVGFSTNNAVVLINGIFQGPTGEFLSDQDYSLSEKSGISSITFTGAATSVAYDPNNASIPVGGYIVSVGSTGGLGYQPLVSAGGTAVVSVAGTIASISIGNTGSGYRSGIQTVNVGVYTSSTGRTGIEFIGTATVSNGNIVSVAITNPGSGYQIGSEPLVVFDAPLSYSNIPLVYSEDSSSGIGTEATVDIVVGQGSSVIDFEIRNFGYRYGQSQILTVATGGSTGIPTDTTHTFEEFQITVNKVDSDKFSAWHFGELERLDNIDEQFDGVKRKFTLERNAVPVTIEARLGSNIDVESTLLIFINDILQVPGEAYEFNGGSVINFTEPPKGPSSDGSFEGDTCKILFYKGTSDVDVTFTEVLPSIKVGDELSVRGDKSLVPNSIHQESRIITEIISSDTVKTNPYYGRGIDPNPNHKRTVTWCKQTVDKVINGKIISKAREVNEPLINPVASIISSVGIGSTVVYVDRIKPLFDSYNENSSSFRRAAIQNQVTFGSNYINVGAAATAVVSIAGTISSIVLSSGGIGYSTTPEISIGIGETRATATATLNDGVVTEVTIVNPGTGYTSTTPPSVLISPPSKQSETCNVSSYSGDSGVIIGFGTTSIGSSSNDIIFELHIPYNSELRNTDLVGTAVTLSRISAGDYFTVFNSNVSVGATNSKFTSFDSFNNIVGITTSYVDSVYQAKSVSVVSRTIGGISTSVLRVNSRIAGVSTIGFSSSSASFDSTILTLDSTGLDHYSGTIYTSNYYGEFSWGKVVLDTRTKEFTHEARTLNGFTGLSTSDTLYRTKHLRFANYTN